MAICNTQGASIPRESDAVLYTHAGPEVAVASTKAFVAQITAAYVLGLYLAQVKGAMYRDEIAQTLESLKDMPRKIQWVLDTQTKTVQEAAEQMVDAKSFLFLGRHVGYPVAMEGALKLKEIADTFTEGFAAGELKPYGATVAKMAAAPEGWGAKGSPAQALAPELQPLLREMCDIYDANRKSWNTCDLLKENYRSFALLSDLYKRVQQLCDEQNMMLLSETKYVLSELSLIHI